MYYSQAQEDQYLNDNYFKDKRDGKYIELGAMDGDMYSNTKYYETQHNWSGILIEPHPIKFQVLKENRPNNFLFNDLISCHTTELKYRYFFEDYCAVSGVENTLPKFFFENCFYNPVFSDSRPQGVLYVKPRSLTDIVKESGIKHFDLLSLDVEGHEYEVLQSWDFSIPIDIILIEQLGLEKDRDELCRQVLLNNGYKFDTPYQHNEIFIRIGSQYDNNVI